jgi:hypothetical protein
LTRLPSVFQDFPMHSTLQIIDRPSERACNARDSKSARGREPKLIVTVDTEEEGLWSGTFSATENTVRNTLELPRFQNLCEQFGVRPTYLIDSPVVENDEAVEHLQAWRQHGACEIGAHLHPWCAPPFEKHTSQRNSYLCNLPAALQRSKLEQLTDRIAERFGRRPTSFRAGRYGLDLVGARLLEELGYQVDSSVLPFTDLSGDGGPDFRRAPYMPYYVGPDDFCCASSSASPQGSLLEVPVSVGFNRRNYRWSQRLLTAAACPMLRPLRLPGVLDALGIVRRIKLTPEFNGEHHLVQLVETYVANRAPCLVLMLHSSSLAVGCSPYSKTAEDVDRVYSILAAVFHYCLNGRGMASATLTEFAEWFNRHSISPHNAVVSSPSEHCH